MTNRKLTSFNKKKETIRCECGAEILLVPYLKAMSDAIELHVSVHMQEKKGLATDAEAIQVEDDLIVQVFRKVVNLR